MGKEAREFQTSNAYSTGDLVMKNGVLYKFTENHSAGTWNSSQVEKVDSDTEQKLTRAISAYDNMERASDFAESFLMETNVINGTRYKMILSNAVDRR